MVRTIYGWGILLTGIMQIGMDYKNYCGIKLIENSMCPGKVILAYPEDMILEYD